MSLHQRHITQPLVIPPSSASGQSNSARSPLGMHSSGWFHPGSGLGTSLLGVNSMHHGLGSSLSGSLQTNMGIGSMGEFSLPTPDSVHGGFSAFGSAGLPPIGTSGSPKDMSWDWVVGRPTVQLRLARVDLGIWPRSSECLASILPQLCMFANLKVLGPRLRMRRSGGGGSCTTLLRGDDETTSMRRYLNRQRSYLNASWIPTVCFVLFPSILFPFCSSEGRGCRREGQQE